MAPFEDLRGSQAEDLLVGSSAQNSNTGPRLRGSASGWAGGGASRLQGRIRPRWRFSGGMRGLDAGPPSEPTALPGLLQPLRNPRARPRARQQPAQRSLASRASSCGEPGLQGGAWAAGAPLRRKGGRGKSSVGEGWGLAGPWRRGGASPRGRGIRGCPLHRRAETLIPRPPTFSSPHPSHPRLLCLQRAGGGAGGQRPQRRLRRPAPSGASGRCVHDSRDGLASFPKAECRASRGNSGLRSPRLTAPPISFPPFHPPPSLGSLSGLDWKLLGAGGCTRIPWNVPRAWLA